MSQKRNMPTKKAILKHWSIEYDMELYDDICWGCSFQSTTYRCHLLAKCKGGNEDVNNLILLCNFCHNIQEHYYSNSIEDSNKFKKMIINNPPFLNIKCDYYNSLIKNGIVK